MIAVSGAAFGPLYTMCPEVALVELGVHFGLFVWERDVALRTRSMSVLLGGSGLRSYGGISDTHSLGWQIDSNPMLYAHCICPFLPQNISFPSLLFLLSQSLDPSMPS